MKEKNRNVFNARLSKFLASGASAAATEYLCFALLHTAGAPLVVSNSTSFGCGLLVSFNLNRRWVFRSQSKAAGQFGVYLTVAAVNLAVSNLLVWLLSEVAGISALAAKLAVMLLVAAWNYVIFSKLVFARKSTP